MTAKGFRLTFNGQVVLTTTLFAAKYGMTIDTARKTLSRLGVDPLDEPFDGRTRVWPAAEIAKAMKARPGKGANLRGHR